MLRVGLITPRTGQAAGFGEVDPYILGLVRDAVKDGITAGDNKGLLDPFSPLSDAHRAYAQAMVNQVHQQFIKVVKEGRGARLKETPETFSGLFWSGESALQHGLADHLGSLDYVAREVVKAAEVIDYTPKENVAERLAKRFGAAVGAGAAKAIAGAVAVR